MLTDKTIALIKATLPVMQEHGEAIAAKTYELLFKHYPQTKPLFSKAPVNQPKILARWIKSRKSMFPRTCIPVITPCLDILLCKQCVRCSANRWRKK